MEDSYHLDLSLGITLVAEESAEAGEEADQADQVKQLVEFDGHGAGAMGRGASGLERCGERSGDS